MSWMNSAQCNSCLMVRTVVHEQRWMAQNELEDNGWWVYDDTHICPQCRTKMQGSAA